MKFSNLAYPDVFDVAGVEYKGQRDRQNSEVRIPCDNMPVVKIGDILRQKIGDNLIQLKVVDLGFQEGGTLKVGTNYPNMLTLHVDNLSSESVKTPKESSTINIGSISGQQVQVGNNNTQITNISLTELVKQVATNNDPQAKGLLRQLLENSTVSAIVGAGASSMLALLGG